MKLRETFEICENGIHTVYGITEDGRLKLLHFGDKPFDPATIKNEDFDEGFEAIEVEAAGYDRPHERQGSKMIGSCPGYLLKFAGMDDTRNDLGRLVVIHTHDDQIGLSVDLIRQYYDGIPVIRMWTKVTNTGNEDQVITYVSSFHYLGFEKEGLQKRDEKIRLKMAYNGWQRELNFREYSLSDLGFDQNQPDELQHSSGLVHFTNTGNWSTKEMLPFGYIENTETGSALYFQIEHNGSWHWEISDQVGHLYVDLCGPSENYAQWFQTLKPGESFTSVPAAVGVNGKGFDDAMGQLTRYRRRIRRPNKDNDRLPIIFNDYMNCLFGDPTTEKEFPLIDAAAEAGCEYFVIDCGWYADGGWWASVGEWQESRKRFPNGLKEVTDYIKKKGMIAGAWLEIEVMGINCPKVARVSDDWFFQRHGRKIYDRSRYQLDFRNPEVIDHANEIVDRLVREYGIGYIKMDYNIEPGVGTEWQAENPGQGLLAHERAYLEWLDGVFRRYPDLVIENCSSGGMRMDYAMLSRYSIQSTSDTEDYRNYATIAANAPAALCPEQAAIWSYPLRDGDREEVVFNMINALLLRIHQSGHLAEISKDRLALVADGLRVYREIRDDLKEALPVWPIGLAGYHDEFISMGLRKDNTLYLAVWRREGEHDSVTLPVGPGAVKAAQIYPAYEEGAAAELLPEGLKVTFAGDYMARLYRIDFE